MPRSGSLPVLAAAAGLALLAPPRAASAHGQSAPIDADHVRVQTDSPPDDVVFDFTSTDANDFVPGHDPRTEGAEILVRGVGPNAGRIPLVSFDPDLWTPAGNGYHYEDPSGSRGGITSVDMAQGHLAIQASAANWQWTPSGPQDEVWVHFRIEDEWYCAKFSATNATVQSNAAGHYEAVSSIAPGSCPTQVCGNGVHEFGEECDDGNLTEGDGCDPDCMIGSCNGTSFESTFEGIQKVVFESEAYGCSRGTCHDSVFPDGNLDLTTDAAYESLLGPSGLGAPSDRGGFLRVLPTEPTASMLYLKLASKQPGYDGPDVGTAMPTGLQALSPEHLEAVRLWIRGGAPRDRVVEGTAQLLGTCFPPADPLKTPVPDPPAPEVGFQLRQPPYPLLGTSTSQGENEVCQATYYDCPSSRPRARAFRARRRYQLQHGCSTAPKTVCTTDEECGEDGPCIVVKNAMNPGDECIAYDHLTVIQDPQSHHSILGNYTGKSDTTDPCWSDADGPGPNRGDPCVAPPDAWTYKFEPDDPDPAHQALNGQPCDPTAIDPALGYNPGCSSKSIEAIACVGYGPTDLGNLSLLTGTGGNFPQLSLSQETYYDFAYPPGVHNVMPIKGVIVWNSHAFNLTPVDSTLAQFLNIDYAPESERVHASEQLFDAQWIFAQFVPPFQQKEICATYTAPQGARLFQLSSHTHRHGTRWRTWGPPNTPCRPQCPTAQDDTALGLLDFIGLCDDDSTLPVCTGPRAESAALLQRQLLGSQEPGPRSADGARQSERCRSHVPLLCGLRQRRDALEPRREAGIVLAPAA
jgi:cysteine-rich repeat protein